MKGKIVKMTLTNFITYEHLEFVPGPYMNMILGPNGSGKSSILCGLCLGLAGKTSSIGRVTKLAEYIKYGCDTATIEIHLQTDKRVVVIQRIINRGATESSGGTSSWSLHGKSSNQKEVEAFVRSLNIHMDNLCQFLSQERVQDFTKMNSKELLVNTEKTVGTTEMYEQHQKLIEMCKSGGGQEKSLDNLQQTLDRETNRLELLQKKMDSMKERLALIKEIDHVKAKIPWVEYNEQIDRMNEAKEDREKTRERIQTLEKEYKPLLKEMQELEDRLNVLKAELRKRTAGPAALMTKFLEEQDGLQENIGKNIKSLKTLEDKKKKFETDLKLIENKISSAKERLQNLESNYDPAEHKQKMADCNKEMKDIENSVMRKSSKCNELRIKVDDITSDIRTLDREMSQQSNVRQRRMDTLRNVCKRSHDASRYLREDLRHHPFHGRVYPSIMLEINMRDARASKYVNSLISRRDKIALLCERREDFNDLFLTLKNQFGKGLNMLVQGAEAVPMNHPLGLQELRNLGFDDYLSNLIDCPPEIFNFLCKSYRIHMIPVAYREGTVREKEAMKYFTNFFIGENQYRVSTSRYTNEKSTRIQQVFNRNNPFADNIDQNAIAAAEQRKRDKEAEILALRAELQTIQEEARQGERQKESIRSKMKELRGVESQLNELRVQIKRAEIQKRDMVSGEGNFEKDKEKLISANKKLFKTITDNLPTFKKHLKKCVEHSRETGLTNIEVKGLTRKVTFKKDALSVKKEGIDSLKRAIANLDEVVKKYKARALELRKIAEQKIGCGPDDPSFKKVQEILSKLPDSIVELENLKTDLESRLEFMEGGEENVSEQLEAQKKKCKKLEKDLLTLRDEVTNRKSKMDELRNKWLPDLEELAERINVKFGRLFNYMGCEGEVVLVKGNPEVEDDYENYGLSIRVSFRDGNALQELGSTQSGGERSVSTAIYLLALQELTHVPFRCLDEINQGMDNTNERRIMELMMKMSSSLDSCQYFLVSPKLLSKLKYADTCRVIVVQQPMRMDTTKWLMSKFIIDKQIATGEKRRKVNGKENAGHSQANNIEDD